MMITMLVGAFHFPTDYGTEIGELARALEERGFESSSVKNSEAIEQAE
jgi:hypothetical protein